MKKLLVILFCLAQTLVLSAQQPMVAYRDTTGVWHYFDTNGKLMWQPYLDVASDPAGWANGLLRARVMDVVTNPDGTPDFDYNQVLYNNKGEVVFRPKVDFRCRITAGFDKLGLLQAENYDLSTLCLFDRKGKLVFEAPNMRSGYLGDGVVYYAKSNADDTSYSNDIPYVIKDIVANKILAEVTCSSIFGRFDEDVVMVNYDAGQHTILTRKGTMPLGMMYEVFYSFADEDPMPKGFAALRKTETDAWALYNKDAKLIIAEMGEPIGTVGAFFQVDALDDEAPDLWFELTKDKATLLPISERVLVKPTLDGVFICSSEETNDEVLITDKMGRLIKRVPTESWDCKVFDHHVWIKTDDETYDCYDTNGQKTGHITAEDFKIAKYGMVVFKQGEVWGLAKENGEIVIKPQFTFGDNIPELRPGFIEITTPVNDEVLFEYYNFEGVKVLSTLASKDNWDYLLLQNTEFNYYIEY